MSPQTNFTLVYIFYAIYTSM